MLQDELDPDYMLRDDFNRGIAALKPFALVYDILIFERHLPQAIQLVDRHPNQVFVLDHLAKPRVKARETGPWAENIRSLARRPNVYCKVSGLVTEAEYRNWTEEQLMPYFDIVLQEFGPSRLMFGSDWPVCLVAIGYAQWVSTVERFCSKLSRLRAGANLVRHSYRGVRIVFSASRLITLVELASSLFSGRRSRVGGVCDLAKRLPHLRNSVGIVVRYRNVIDVNR